MSPTGLIQNRHRDELLTNSAAEFLETRADTALGPELTQQPPEFVPELDRFVPPASIVRPDYYKESQKKLLQFQQTLEAFRKTLIERKFSERYDLELKDSYTIQDVLAIAQTVQERHQNAEEVHSCAGRIRKFFRASARNASTFQRFLEFVPNGDYTSMLCGGFTLILGALDKLETLRTDMYQALGDIPKIMSRIHRHLAVHFQSARLRHCADVVWVAVFTVLEAIIRELSTKSTKKALKALIKGDLHAADVTTALATLNAGVSEFETEANICDSERLGQVDRLTQDTWSTMKRTESSVQQLSHGMSSIAERLENRLTQDQQALSAKQDRLLASTEQLLENQKLLQNVDREEVHAEQVQVNVYNVFYCFLTASPSFDSKTGALENLHTGNRLIRSTTPLSMDEIRTTLSATPLSRSPSHLSPFALHQYPALSAKSTKAARSWVQQADRPDRVAARDLRSCLGDISAQASLKEQEQIAYILASDELREWLRTTTSQVFVVELGQGPGNQYFTAASYASAVLARSLLRAAPSPVLTHLCAARETDPEIETFMGGKGILISLVGQLAAHLSSLKQGTKSGIPPDLTFLADDKRTRFARVSESISKLLALFGRLLSLIVSQSRTVYVILDGISRLATENKEANQAIAGILELASSSYAAARRDERRTILKVVITQPFSVDLHEFLPKQDGHGSNEPPRRRHHSVRHSSATPVQRPPYIKDLHVPENVLEGGGTGFNADWINGELDAMVHECTSSSSSAHSQTNDSSDSGRDSHSQRRQGQKKSKSSSRLSVGSSTRRKSRGHGEPRSGRWSTAFLDESESD